MTPETKLKTKVTIYSILSLPIAVLLSWLVLFLVFYFGLGNSPQSHLSGPSYAMLVPPDWIVILFLTFMPALGAGAVIAVLCITILILKYRREIKKLNDSSKNPTI